MSDRASAIAGPVRDEASALVEMRGAAERAWVAPLGDRGDDRARRDLAFADRHEIEPCAQRRLRLGGGVHSTARAHRLPAPAGVARLVAHPSDGP